MVRMYFPLSSATKQPLYEIYYVKQELLEQLHYPFCSRRYIGSWYCYHVALLRALHNEGILAPRLAAYVIQHVRLYYESNYSILTA